MYGEKNLEKTFWVPDGNWSQDLPDTTGMLLWSKTEKDWENAVQGFDKDALTTEL